jgi:cellulose synthase/poly-beta-1,6-N-acetylglucosamine synthase-like glycosyltransferase
MPLSDPLGQGHYIRWRFKYMFRDFAKVTWNTGTGWIARRETIEDIGGFPTNCVTEDGFSSALFLANGWRTAYVAEALQYGLMPDTFSAHLKQFTRWVCHIRLSCLAPSPRIADLRNLPE